MDLVLEDKISLNDTPLQLTCQPNNISSSIACSPQMSTITGSTQVSSLCSSTVTVPTTVNTPTSQPSFASGVPTLLPPSQMSYSALSVVSSQHLANATSKYAQLLQVIEELGKDIRPTYSGSKSSGERLKRGIIHARILVRECLMETERNNARN